MCGADDRGGGGSQSIGVELVGLAHAGAGDTVGGQLAVHVDERGAALLAAQLSLLEQPGQAASQKAVELAGDAREAVGHREGEDVGLDRVRREGFDLDLHSARMLSDALRTLRQMSEPLGSTSRRARR